jgi:hypothetical protein
MECKFTNPCKYYKKESITFNDDEEADGYCGCYRQFRNLMIIKTCITSDGEISDSRLLTLSRQRIFFLKKRGNISLCSVPPNEDTNVEM